MGPDQVRLDGFCMQFLGRGISIVSGDLLEGLYHKAGIDGDGEEDG